MKNIFRITVGVSLLTIGFLCQRASAQPSINPYFSIDSASPSTASFSPSDILVAGPTVFVPYANLGLVAGDDMSDFTWGDLPPYLYFTVDRASGAPGSTFYDNVQGQWSRTQAAGDVFAWLNPGNKIAVNQNSLGLIPNVGPTVYNNTTPIDHIDGLTLINNPYSPAYALTPGSPTLGTIGGTASDIFYSPSGIPTILLTYSALGLKPNDVIEGLAHLGQFNSVYGDGEWLITLAPGSPSLISLDVTSSDILYDYADGSSPGIYLTYDDLGLSANDNVTAIALVPEPSSALFIGFGALIICGMRRFQSWRRQN